jgi:poly(A) polymerase
MSDPVTAATAALNLEPARLAAAALPDDERVWIVGGAVRDAALGGGEEVDLAIDGDAAEAARRIARSAGGHPFELSGEFATWRVVAPDQSWKLDIAELRGESIEADLRLRDFTINAVAVPLAGGDPIDPTGGLTDLDSGCLRAASERSFADDPLRILRAARLCAALDLEPEAETLALARAESSRAGEPAGERQFAELAAMVSGPDPERGIELLDLLGATPGVLPELAALRGVGQSANHHLDVHDHTLEVLRRMLEVEADLERFAGPVADRIGELLALPLADDLTRRQGLRFAALLHDVGKPVTRSETTLGVRFIGHDGVGAEMIREICVRLRTSRRFSDYLAAIARDHLVLGFMVKDRPLPARRVWEYLRRTGTEAVDTTLLTVADRLAAQGGGVPETAIAGHLALAQEMLAAAVAWEIEGPAEPLLRGDEIATEVGIDPGPRLGEAVRELEAAQYAAEVTDRDAAIAHLRAWQGSR